MPATINRLTAVEVKDAKTPGRLPDGGGLHLQVGPNGSKSWLFIFRWEGKRPEIGLGPYPQVSLASARRRAEDARSILSGRPKQDPRVVWAAAVPAARMTFGDFVDDWLPALIKAFRNPKHQQQWENTLKTYAGSLRPMWLDEIDTEAVLAVLAGLAIITATERADVRCWAFLPGQAHVGLASVPTGRYAVKMEFLVPGGVGYVQTQEITVGQGDGALGVGIGHWWK